MCHAYEACKVRSCRKKREITEIYQRNEPPALFCLIFGTFLEIFLAALNVRNRNYFIRPQVSIVSQSDNLSTEKVQHESSTVCDFSVRHRDA